MDNSPATIARDRLYEAISSDMFVCGFDLYLELDDFEESMGKRASDGLPPPQAPHERHCQSILEAQWQTDEDDMGGNRHTYPVFVAITGQCPESHGWNEDSEQYRMACARWSERRKIRRLLANLAAASRSQSGER